MNEDQEKKLQFSQEKISTAKPLLENEKFSDSISQSYYGMVSRSKSSSPRKRLGSKDSFRNFFRAWKTV